MCSDKQRGSRRKPAILAGLLALGSSLAWNLSWGHPELLEQINRLSGQIAGQPGNARLLLQRGDLYRRHGDYTSAWQDFTAARALEPGLPDTDFYSGRLALEMGDSATAIAQLNRYLEQHPDHAAAWSLRAEAYLAEQEPLQAAADFGQAISRSTHPTPSLYLQQARAFQAAGSKQLGKAQAVTDDGLRLFPRDVALLALGTDIALELGQGETARHYLDSLPPAIRSLPKWQHRAALLESLAAGQPMTGPGDVR